MTATIADLKDMLSGDLTKDPAYRAKQLHPIPDAPVVSREEFILDRCLNKVVLDIGASGQMHAAICEVASKVYGIDRESGDGIEGIDLDNYHASIPAYGDVEVVVCGEVLEHLSNAGMFLRKLRDAYAVPIIITVPNAFTSIGQRWLNRGIECTNIDHIAYHSPRTIKTLLQRAGFEIQEWAWYNGQPRTAEGIIAVTE